MRAIPLSRAPVDDEITHAVLQPAVAQHGSSRLPDTERVVDEILTLPIPAGHTTAEIDAVAAAVRAFSGV